jgi:hypothetical protein
MYRVTDVKAKPNYTLFLTFEDGTQGDICISDRLFGPMFEPLKDPAYFAQVKVDQFGAVVWPNDADLAPDALYMKVKQSQ